MKYVPTEKQNRSMKAKVLKYKFDGNTIVAPYMELEPYAENVFISLARKNEYGNESEDCFHVIARLVMSIFPADSIHAESLTRRDTGKKRQPIARTGLKTP